MRESSSMYCRSSLEPRAQFKPTLMGSAWRIEFQNASVTWPESVRPLASVMVPEIMIGTSRFSSSRYSLIAKIAAFAFRVSKIVSTSSRSTPPSTSPRAASLYASLRSSKVTFLKLGLFTSGDREAVRLVGPMAPATKRGLSGVIRKTLPPVILLVKPVFLDHSTHRAVQDDDALLQQGPKFRYPGLPLLVDRAVENHEPLSV